MPENDEWWHGTPSGDLRGGPYGLHVGTYEAAKQALEARIGRPADGRDWDGTRAYGETPLGGYKVGYGVDALPDHLPSGKATYGDGTPIPMDARPNLHQVRIVGPMTNTPDNAYDDFRANGYMHGQISRGRAKRGFYYTNVGEDSGSISAVVPNGDHLEVVNHNPITAARKVIRLAQQAADLQWQRSYTDGSWQLMAQDPSGIFQTVMTAPRVQGMYYQISAAHKAIRNAMTVTKDDLKKELLRREQEKEVDPLQAYDAPSLTQALQTYIHLDSR